MPADLIKTKTHSTCSCVIETFLVEILLLLVRNFRQYEAILNFFESNANFSSNQFQTANYISNNTHNYIKTFIKSCKTNYTMINIVSC